MFSDGVVELYEQGVVTNRCKSVHPDKMVATFLMGTRRLYDFVDDNPIVNMFPVNYVNDPVVIGQADAVHRHRRPGRLHAGGRAQPGRQGHHRTAGDG